MAYNELFYYVECYHLTRAVPSTMNIPSHFLHDNIHEDVQDFPHKADQMSVPSKTNTNTQTQITSTISMQSAALQQCNIRKHNLKISALQHCTALSIICSVYDMT